MKIRVSELRRLIKEELAGVYEAEEDEGAEETQDMQTAPVKIIMSKWGTIQFFDKLKNQKFASESQLGDLVEEFLKKVKEVNPTAAGLDTGGVMTRAKSFAMKALAE
jgi:hypothetical protein